jgi:hypothetical protein
MHGCTIDRYLKYSHVRAIELTAIWACRIISAGDVSHALFFVSSK